ncbi:hypothetical protein R3P38DRAFT_2803165 [Favolaschia claudopus]|uniref:Uncharacterized protein n=1 Tax=Favolaschia claudopus TaxID=2862362 RepID=A0AAV9ZTJ7_9AGAR
MRIYDNGFMPPTTCKPKTTPAVDHEYHSARARCSYYVRFRRTPEATSGYSGYCRFSVATLDTVIASWDAHCTRSHGFPCPNAPPAYWGIRGIKILFSSKKEALEHAREKQIEVVNIKGSLDEPTIREFVGLF